MALTTRYAFLRDLLDWLEDDTKSAASFDEIDPAYADRLRADALATEALIIVAREEEDE